MITKKELYEQLVDTLLLNSVLEKRNEDLQEIIERKTAIIDAIVFKDKEKLNNIKDFDAYQEFMNDVFDNPIKTATC